MAGEESVKIILDFGAGNKRKYFLGGEAVNALARGDNLAIEFCHPYFGEIFIVKLRKKRDIYGRSPSLYGLTNYCCNLLKKKLKAKSIKLHYDFEPAFRKKLALEMTKQIFHIVKPKRRG